MYTYDYPRPSVTATVFAFHEAFKPRLVVGTRSDDSDAFPGLRCVPGGFLNARNEVYNGETVKETAIREFQEECGIRLDPIQLILFHEHSHPDTDPRAHVVNLCFIANLRDWQADNLKAGDDLKSLELLPFKKIHEIGWAFNHYDLAKRAIRDWTSEAYFRN